MDVVLEMVLPEDAEDSSGPSNEKQTLTTRRAKLSKRERRRQEENSNAEVCPHFNFDTLNGRLKTEDCGRTVFSWLVRIVCVMFGVMCIAMGHTSGAFASNSAKDALIAVAFVGLSVCALLSMFLVAYLRHVLRLNERLDTLGAGSVKISARAAPVLKKARKALCIPKLVFVGSGPSQARWA